MNVVHKGNGRAVVLGDCLEAMREMPDVRFTACVTDPPYALKFMGKIWDRGLPGKEYWSEVLRVCKPGAFLLAFGGTRTHHRLACAIEDAGWEVRDCLMWVYGSGFPKSLSIGKALDKKAGATRPKIGERRVTCGTGAEFGKAVGTGHKGTVIPVTAPATDAAKCWEGYGTALKPAWEPIIVAMKPLDGTFAANALKHGVAGLNIDAGRIGSSGGGTHCTNRDAQGRCKGHKNAGRSTSGETFHGPETAGGRWPANLVLQHDERCARVGTREVKSDGHYPARRGEGGLGTSGHVGQDGLEEAHTAGEEVDVYACVPGCPVRMLDAQSGVSKSSGGRIGKKVDAAVGNVPAGQYRKGYPGFGDVGGASRFFYCAKASTRERNAGMPEGQKCAHPTVKPLRLIEYLLKLVTMPEGTLVLDPFVGSGTTLCAAARLGLRAVGIDSDPASCETAAHRLKHWEAEAAK